MNGTQECARSIIDPKRGKSSKASEREDKHTKHEPLNVLRMQVTIAPSLKAACNRKKRLQPERRAGNALQSLQPL